MFFIQTLLMFVGTGVLDGPAGICLQSNKLFAKDGCALEILRTVEDAGPYKH